MCGCYQGEDRLPAVRRKGEQWLRTGVWSQRESVTLQAAPRQAAELCVPVATPATGITGAPISEEAPSPWELTCRVLGAVPGAEQAPTKEALVRNPGPLSHISCPLWPHGPWPSGFVPRYLTHSASFPGLRCWLAAVSPELGYVIM